MPSSTSNSEMLNRDIPEHQWNRLFLFAFILFAIGIAGWDAYWRSEGFEASYINSDSLWAMERRKVQNDSVVFTGSSRVLFGIQIDIWEKELGIKPIQLALEGTSPISILEDLADDDNFHGTVFSGVAPGLFFSGFEYRGGARKIYFKEQPSQWLGQQLSMLIEPYFVFMDPDLALFKVIKRQNWPKRESVNTSLDVRMLSTHSADRNSQMLEKVSMDEEYRKLAIKIWSEGFKSIEERDEEWLSDAKEKRTKQIDRAVKVAEKFKAKGVELIFLRMPSQGFYMMSEDMYHPREDTWDVLIAKTGAKGINFKDFQQLSKYVLPEDSHLTAKDAKSYTKNLALIYSDMNNSNDQTDAIAK